jgi:uncharacterized membrane protein
MLIHFPSALFPMSFICSLAAFYTGKASFNDAAFFTLAGGVAGGWLAAIAGFFDLVTVVEKKPTAVKKALIHGGINTLVLIGFTLFLFRANKSYPALMVDSVVILVIKAVLIMAMIIGNFMGGSLVLKDKINVEE